MTGKVVLWCFFFEWNEWKNPQFNFASQNLSIERNFFKWDGKETKILHLLFHRIWKKYLMSAIAFIKWEKMRYRRCTMKKLNCTFCYSDFISETKQGLKIKIKIQYLKKFIYSTSVSRSRLAASAFSSCSIRAEINEHLADWHWHGIGWVLVAGSKTSTCIAYCLSFFLLPSSTLLNETSQPMISSISTSSSPPVLPN